MDEKLMSTYVNLRSSQENGMQEIRALRPIITLAGFLLLSLLLIVSVSACSSKAAAKDEGRSNAIHYENLRI